MTATAVRGSGRSSGLAAIRSSHTSRHTFRLGKRLSASVLSALVQLLDFAERWIDAARLLQSVRRSVGPAAGSNYDPTGNNTQGRVTVVFRGNWAQDGLFRVGGWRGHCCGLWSTAVQVADELEVSRHKLWRALSLEKTK